MLLALVALLPSLHAAPVGGPGQRFGFGVHAGVGGGLTAKFYVSARIALSGSAGTWGLLIRRQTLLVEVDAWEREFNSGTLVTTIGVGVAREYDGFWRDEAHQGIRLATGAVWRWHDRPFEFGTEFGVDLYNYDWSAGQFGELPTAAVLLRWYPHFSG